MKQRAQGTPLADFVLDEAARVFRHPDHPGLSYSDGEGAEAQVLQTLRHASEVRADSRELNAAITNWVSEYHLSRERLNLIRHLRFEPGQRILELGAGCGALTRFLGESGAQVTAVEGSVARARIARERCRDLENVRVFAADFSRLALEPDFDSVTLIGVLEYSPRIDRPADPALSTLEIARSGLREGGRLVVAIENQLGLKYFCGAAEDHLSKPYVGLQDGYVGSGVRTYGQEELRRLIREAGFSSSEFRYPFPDYKLPRVILFESAFESDDFMPDEIVRHLPARDYGGENARQIDASRVWPVLARNGLMQALSNSFLILASNGSQGEPDVPVGTLAVAYTAERADGFATATIFRRSSDGLIRVEKRRLYGSAPEETFELRQTLSSEGYVRGRALHSEALEALCRGEMGCALDILREWIDFLYVRRESDGDTTWSARLPGNLVDCLPFNLVRGRDGTIRVIDLEWEFSGKLWLGSVALRYLRGLAQVPECQGGLGVSSNHARRDAESLRRLLLGLKLEPGTGAYADFEYLSTEIDRAVYPTKPRLDDEALRQVLAHPTDEIPGPTVRSGWLAGAWSLLLTRFRAGKHDSQ